MDKLLKPYLISWRSGADWRGKAIVMALSPVQAWEKYTDNWIRELESREADLDINEIDKFEVELAGDEFVE